MNNVPRNIIQKFGTGLHMMRGHPLCTVKNLIYNLNVMLSFERFDDFPPLVSLQDNFDMLLIPKDHPSRRPSDTYYWDDHHVLRTHTSAHQVPLLISGKRAFLVTGDVYRKDDIDATHYPIFHQMEGVCIWENGGPHEVEANLKSFVNVILGALFKDCEPIWKPDYFPFTDPSWEVSIAWKGKELEVMGCGIIHKDVLKNGAVEKGTGWAFGLGLERLAMILYEIPDIRLFWSKDSRFLNQFQVGKVTKFKSFSTQPACYKDIAFWISSGYEKTSFYELIQNIAGDLVEEVKEIDTFEKEGRTSKTYRISYRALNRTLENTEVDTLQHRIRNSVIRMGGVELR